MKLASILPSAAVIVQIANSLPKRAHHSMPLLSMPTSKPNDMKHILILILCAFVLSCKSTKTASSSNESERNAVSQAQWRSAQNLSFSSLQRLTALSFDSCVFTFGVSTRRQPLNVPTKAIHRASPCPMIRQSLHLITASRHLSGSTDFTFPKRKRRSPQLHSRWKTASQ